MVTPPGKPPGISLALIHVEARYINRLRGVPSELGDRGLRLPEFGEGQKIAKTGVPLINPPKGDPDRELVQVGADTYTEGDIRFLYEVLSRGGIVI